MNPVTLHLDGSALPAERGEPLAVSLLAANKLILSRSPKLHRPRSAACLRGGCEGCLMRVEGAPNVLTCLEPARGDEHIEAQNVVGSRKADLLRVNDWLFPNGFDHHHFMTDVPSLGPIVQSFARKVSGLGRLPSEVLETQKARRIDVDVVVIGAGLAGLVVAHRLSTKGKRVAVVDDGIRLGGSLNALLAGADLLERFRPTNALEFVRTTAAGVYQDELVMANAEGALVVRANHKVFATGAHDGVLAFGGNDLPGVFSARALCLLHAYGVEPEETVALVGDGFWAAEIERRFGERATPIDENALVGVTGTAGVKGVKVREDKRERTIRASVLAVAAKGAPAFEVAAQAGANVRFVADRGYAVECDPCGRAGAGLWAVGENTGQSFDVETIIDAAERCAQAILD